MDLQAYQVPGPLQTVFYLPGYLSPAEEERLTREIHASKAKWTQLSGRRLQNHGGIVHPKGLIPTPLPRWLESVAQPLHTQLHLFGEAAANHVLINAYQPGEGIMPHQDGPLYHPVVAILSLGTPVVLRFWRKQPEGGTGGQPSVLSLVLEPRSLLVFQGDAYEGCLHGIEDVHEERLDGSVANLHMCSLAQLRSLAEQGPLQAAAGCSAGSDASGGAGGPDGALGTGAQSRAADCSTCCGQPAGESCSVSASASTGVEHSAAAHTSTAGQTVQPGQQQQQQQRRACGCDSGSHDAQGASPETLRRSGERLSLTVRRVLNVRSNLIRLR